MSRTCYWSLITILILVLTPAAKAQSPWYHHTNIYQIYPRSYYDTDGDGIGDLKGVIKKLDYIQQLGFETIWLSPFFQSPQQDLGYDISNYYAIAPEYGDTATVRQLIRQTHQRGMKIVFDLVLNHTSIDHPWFQEDLRLPKDAPTHYVWRDKKNNWQSMVTGNAWHYRPERNQFYYAAFLPFQPDLNYRNPEVRTAMLQVARHWLQQGVDGFRLDIINSLYEAADFKNNPTVFSHRYTANQPEALEFTQSLRALCDSFGEKILLGEVIGPRAISRKFCGDSINNRLGLAFDFEMLRFHFNAKYFRHLLKHLEQDFHPPFMPVYVFSNHDRRRMLTRLKGNTDKARLLHLLQFTARGVSCTYYGEEIGMTDVPIPYREAIDPIPHTLKLPRGIMNLVNETLNRDEVRTPMRWSKAANAGFTSGKSWLPMGLDKNANHVESQQRDSTSLWHFFKQLNACRSQPLFQYGNLQLVTKHLPANTLAYTREWQHHTAHIYLHFGKQPIHMAVPPQKTVTLQSGTCTYDANNGTLILGKYSAVVLQ
ncbi:MAG: alpha-amylase family glycosyl hydrolase [Chitinophagales bacterium]